MDNLIPDTLSSDDLTALSTEQQNQLLRQIPQWIIVNVKQTPQLQRSFSFRNFMDAITFTNRVAELAETADHHPSLLTEWGKVTVSWWTHRIGGLQINDFVMANRTEQAYAKQQATKPLQNS